MLKIKFESMNDGTRMTFDKTALTVGSCANSLGYLKSIFIPTQRDSKVRIEFEHPVPQVPQWGCVSSDEFAQLLSFYFYNQHS